MRSRTLSVDAPVMAPSMLKCDFADLAGEVRRLESAQAQVLHWDVMDAHFVPNLSYGAMLINSVRSRTDLFFDAHLMISDPAKYLDDYLAAGCDAITIHLEAVPEPTAILKQIRSAGVKAGLALSPKTPAERIARYAGDCDLVLVMSVEPGFGGQAFMPQALDKLRELRNLVPPTTWISIDGGIGPKTITDAAAAGAQIFVAGSSIFDRDDYAEAMRDLETRAAAGWASGAAERQARETR